MNASSRPRINPLSRQPRHQRLVMAVRGGAGVGKSFFVRSMADAGLGRLCVFDVERKTRLLGGVGEVFDGLEVERPDELPEFIDWALVGDGREQGYGCFALDSWAAYFSSKHSETIAAVRTRTGDPLAQPTAEELAADQMVLQGVLRRLCMESGKSVVIVDQIPARGKEAKEDNEVGRVLPMTASGLEYFVDVMAEVSLQERQGEIVRVFQIIKSNSPAFQVGFELVGDVTFKDFLACLPNAEMRAPTVPETLPADEVAVQAKVMTIEDLLAKAEEHGFSHADIVTVARVYHGQSNIYRLSPEQILDLDRRMEARVGKAAAAPASKGAVRAVAAAAASGARAAEAVTANAGRGATSAGDASRVGADAGAGAARGVEAGVNGTARGGEPGVARGAESGVNGAARGTASAANGVPRSSPPVDSPKARSVQ